MTISFLSMNSKLIFPFISKNMNERGCVDYLYYKYACMTNSQEVLNLIYIYNIISILTMFPPFLTFHIILHCIQSHMCTILYSTVFNPTCVFSLYHTIIQMTLGYLGHPL